MITSLSVENFKCFNKICIDLKNITILAGTNSSGKSTLIQAILLLSHNITNKVSTPLNGDIVSIGTFKEARNFITNAKEIKLTVFENEKSCTLTIEEDDNLQPRSKIECTENSILNTFDQKKGCINYLSANRIGHRDLYLKKYSTDHMMGILGEYSIDYFQRNKNTPLPSKLVAYKESTTFSAQVNYWLKEILGCELITEDIQGTDSIKAQYSQHSSRPVRPRNVGSGISYLVSIIIVCLSAKVNDLIIIENPEIHLHPRAQARLADFFAFVSNASTQLLIETHSDHIFNGIRRNVKNNNISSESISLNYFSFNDRTQNSEHNKIHITKEGKITNHQIGLFDQFNSDLNSLLDI